MFPKIIVTTGCSYGLFQSAFIDIFEKDKKQFPGLEFVVDLHSNSMGSTFQALSIIECVDKLLKNGANASDIYILGEFSEMRRRDIIIANEFLVNEIDNTNIIKYNNSIKQPKNIIYPNIRDFYLINKRNPFREKLETNKLNADTFPKFEKYYIINPENSNLINFPNKNIQPIFENYLNISSVKINGFEVDVSGIESINRALSYFQNIMFVQEYLKVKNIKYKFCLMNNQFSLYNDSSFRQDKLQTKKINGEHYLNQDYTNSNQIWDISNPIKIIKDLINWDNWWFYENNDKNIIWGGIDEYAIDKFGSKAYSNGMDLDNLFGQHPNGDVYTKLLREELMKECFYD